MRMLKKIIAGIAILIFMVIPLKSSAEIEDFEGYQGFVDVGYTFSNSDDTENAIEVTTTHGIQIIPSYLFFGVGSGLQIYHDSSALTMPLFVDVRSALLADQNASPFIYFKIGYSGVVNKTTEIQSGGLYLSPSLGCMFVVQDYVALNLSLGYTYQNLEGSTYWCATDKKNIHGITIKIGFQF